MLEKFRRVFSLSSVYFLGKVGEKSLNFFFLPLYTYYLTTNEFGIFALMILTISLINRLSITPVTGAFTRFFYAPEYDGKQESFVGHLLYLLIVQSLLFGVLFWLSRSQIARWILDPQQVHVVEVFTVILMLQPFKSFFLLFLRMREKASLYVTISIVKIIASASVILSMLIVFEYGLMSLVWGRLVAFLVPVVLAGPIILKNSEFSLNPGVLKEPMKYAYPRLASGYSNFLIQSADRYLLRIFLDLSSVGLYSFGYKFGKILNAGFITPVKHAVSPLIFQEEDNPEKLRRFVRKGATYFYLIVIFLCLILSVFSREIVQLMATKKEFWDAWVIVPLIGFSYAQHGLGHFVSKGMTMAKKSWHNSWVFIYAALMNIFLNIIFIPHYQLLGAASATLASYFFWNGLKIYYSEKFYDMNFELWRLVYISLVFTVILGLSFVFNTFISKLLLITTYPLFFLINFLEDKERAKINELWNDFIRGDMMKSVNMLLGLD